MGPEKTFLRNFINEISKIKVKFPDMNRIPVEAAADLFRNRGSILKDKEEISVMYSEPGCKMGYILVEYKGTGETFKYLFDDGCISFADFSDQYLAFAVSVFNNVAPKPFSRTV
jgi:hypothetical protein